VLTRAADVFDAALSYQYDQATILNIDNALRRVRFQQQVPLAAGSPPRAASVVVGD
jgi:hypothetical protein